MFWAIIEVFASVIYIISAEDAPWMLRDLLLDGWMLAQKFSNLFMFSKIFTVVYQCRIHL